MGMRFGTWNIRSHYWAGSLITGAREIAMYEYKLDLVGVQVRGIGVALNQQVIIHFSMEMGILN
jgi:hypothetical protein